MGILINPKGRSPSGHSVLEKQHLSNKMIVFQDALIRIHHHYYSQTWCNHIPSDLWVPLFGGDSGYHSLGAGQSI